MRRRRISLKAVACAATVVGFSPPVLAGPYSSGLANTTVNALDPGIPGFISGSVNPAFVGWATGYTSYAPAPGVASGWNDPTSALGPVTGDNFSIVSLGDLNATQIAAGAAPGQITLSFKGGIRNGPNADFAVFENAFGSNTSLFGELGYVEVSSDGTHFARFASDSLTPSAVGAFGNIDPTNVHNLAGKHINAFGNSYGTPFDLSDLSADPLVGSGLLNLHDVRYVRIADIPGNGSFLDSSGRPIYDAWLTTGSGGFDLEAIGVTNAWLGGDANYDGAVNLADLKILATNWGRSNMEFSQGNFDLKGTVDVGDLSVLARNWQGGGASLGAMLTSLSLPAVPEPASLGVIASMVALLARPGRSSKRSNKYKIEGRKIMFRSAFTIVFLSLTVRASAATADFQDLALPPDSFHNSSSFTSGGAGFNNSFTDFTTFTIWDGFAYSNMTDTTTPGFGNQYSAKPGHGAGNSSNYGIGFVGDTIPTITLPAGANPLSLDATNTTYAYFSMHDGDTFAKKFGGASGNDLDFFTLTITGKDALNSTVGQVDFKMADFSFANNAQDYILTDWTTIDLSSLAGSQTLSFTLASSDNGQFGMNTPAYFALDNVVFTPEPGVSLVSLFGMFYLARRRVGRREI